MVTAFQFFFAYLIVDLLCVALTLIIASKVSRDSGSETQVRYFFAVLASFMAFAVLDGVWAFVAYSELVDVGELALSVVNGLSLTAVGFAAYFWLCFTLARFNSKITDSHAMRLLLAIPAILVPVLHIIGRITNQNIITLSDGSWTYGVCHITITAFELLYIVAATAVAMQKYRHATSQSERRLCLVFISFMVPFVVAGIVDSLLINTPIVAACIMVSLAFVMMSMQESRISSDALTGLNNRRRADEFLEDSLQHVSAERPLCLFILDLDDFKSINDTYGHLEGDRTLQLVANALRTTCAQTNTFAARWGGDEFILILVGAVDFKPDQVASLVHSNLANTVEAANVEYQLKCSIGYAMCTTPNADGAAIIAQADDMLYEAKRAGGKRRAKR